MPVISIQGRYLDSVLVAVNNKPDEGKALSGGTVSALRHYPGNENGSVEMR